MLNETHDPGLTSWLASANSAGTDFPLQKLPFAMLPNYKWVLIGYHGRVSSIGVSGQAFVRPKGQIKAPDADAPALAPSQRMDIELELGIFGKQPLQLPGGEQRTFLQDGDSVVLRGWCERPGAARIGFGECWGTVLPAKA
ncbi:MAG: hypothetical protein ABI574_02990 [Burkholderiales bacterium]